MADTRPIIDELLEFLRFQKSIFGALAGFTSLFPLSNGLMGYLSIPKGSAGLYTTLATILSFFFLLLIFVFRAKVNNVKLGRLALCLILFGIICVAVYLSACHALNLNTDSPITKWYGEFVLIPYSIIFASITSAFAVLATRLYMSRPFEGKAPSSLVNSDAVEIIQTFVGPWTVIEGSVKEMIRKPQTKQVDVLVIFSVREFFREFLEKTEGKLRVCMSNLADPELLEIYLRKFTPSDQEITDQDRDKLRNNFATSIRRVFGGGDCDVKVEGGTVAVRNASKASVERVELFLTRHRVATGYWRIDDSSWIVPLDTKQPKDPTPWCWWINKELHPKTFARYETEFKMVIRTDKGEAIRVIPEGSQKA